MDAGQLQAYGAITLCAVLPIYAGSYGSIRKPKTAKSKDGSARKLDDDEEGSEDEEDMGETLTVDDAKLFPFIASAALFGLFLVFKYVDKNTVNMVLNVYFLVVGAFALQKTLLSTTKNLLGPALWQKKKAYSLTFAKEKSTIFRFKGSKYHGYVLLLTIALTALNQYTKFWGLANIMALSLAFNGITLLRLDSFATGLILLAGLLLYDIWWVFGSEAVVGQNVMVTVATSVEGPILITWPRDLLRPLASRHSMLGLGDIVVPGIFVAFCLRFDYFLAQQRSKAVGSSSSVTPLVPKVKAYYPKPYFHACMVAYIVGLITTITVMHVFRSAQPALLYLSPACGLTVWACALYRGEVKELWAYADSEQEEEDKARKKEAQAKEKVKEKDDLLPAAPDANTKLKRHHDSSASLKSGSSGSESDVETEGGAAADDEAPVRRDKTA